MNLIRLLAHFCHDRSDEPSPMTDENFFPIRDSAAGRGRVLIVGGSTRAAAWSAVRAGWQPVCADLFADEDTRQVAEVISVRDYPRSLPDDVARVQAEGWFYTGALENYPDIIEQLSQPNATYGPLWGTTAAALRLVRDPQWLASTLREASLPALTVRPETSPPPTDGIWMQKPIASAGGRAIRVWDRSAERAALAEPHYFQQRARGESCSALFRAESHRVEWLGASRQLIHFELSRAPIPFAYCGSVGPIDRVGTAVSISESVRFTLTRIAQTVTQAAALQGLFSIDFLLNGHDICPTEINPRYTASVEVLELANGRALLPTRNGHGENAPRQDRLSVEEGAARPFVAKLILYAAHRFTAPDLTPLLHRESLWQTPLLADIPAPGTVIEPEWPICTVLADGSSFEQCQANLMLRVQQLKRLGITGTGDLSTFHDCVSD